MLFNSLSFFLFFPIVTISYFSLPHRWRWLLLLVSSCFFYMFFIPAYILILLFTIVLDYFLAIHIERLAGKKRRWLLWVSLASNIGILAFFKYANFISANLNNLLDGLGLDYMVPYLSIILPIGLSFHTFQAMSYMIEVYWGKQKAERHLGIYALYVMFYPQLVAGPIERPQNLLHQFREKHSFDYQRVVGGLKLMAWGLFLKVVIADHLALFVNQVFAQPGDYPSAVLLWAAIFFSFQIYCDFYGYSTIAIGAAQVMGFRLMKNFNHPYAATSIREFWQRWHISLSTWFKDYVYIPLGGNKVSIPRWYVNTLLIFGLSGIWHGPSWMFLIWGLLHAFYIIFGRISLPVRTRLYQKLGLSNFPKIHQFLKIVIVFSFVTIAWIFFRAENLPDAWYMISHIFTGWADSMSFINIRAIAKATVFSKADMFFAISYIIFLLAVEYVGRHFPDLANKAGFYQRWLVYYLLIGSIIFLGVWGQQQFIYFQF